MLQTKSTPPSSRKGTRPPEPGSWGKEPLSAYRGGFLFSRSGSGGCRLGEFLIYERFLWFDAQVRRGKYPNASSLAEHFEISPKTAQRTIDFFRDRLMAPLVYDQVRRGYGYEDGSFALPGPMATQDEMLALLLARGLLQRGSAAVIGGPMARIVQKVLRGLTGRLGIGPEAMDERFSAQWHGYAEVAPQVFGEVLQALIDTRLLRLAYRPPGASEARARTVEPHHLQHYMANWVLIAFCRERNDWRKFSLARMDGLTLLHETFPRRPREAWGPLVETNFGIFQGPRSVRVILRFSPFRAQWIKEQRWHPEQTLTPLPDGGLDLSFPVADFREVKMTILQFGAEVKVMEPEALAREIAEEIARMTTVYG